MANHGRDRRSGRFISAEQRRVQTLQRLADLPEHEWELDDEAMVILEGGITLAISGGWIPPTNPEVES